MHLVTGITVNSGILRQIKGKSFPPSFCQMMMPKGLATMIDSLITVSARLTLFSIFVMLLALAGAGV